MKLGCFFCPMLGRMSTKRPWKSRNQLLQLNVSVRKRYLFFFPQTLAVSQITDKPFLIKAFNRKSLFHPLQPPPPPPAHTHTHTHTHTHKKDNKINSSNTPPPTRSPQNPTKSYSIRKFCPLIKLSTGVKWYFSLSP